MHAERGQQGDKAERAAKTKAMAKHNRMGGEADGELEEVHDTSSLGRSVHQESGQQAPTAEPHDMKLVPVFVGAFWKRRHETQHCRNLKRSRVASWRSWFK